MLTVPGARDPVNARAVKEAIAMAAKRTWPARTERRRPRSVVAPPGPLRSKKSEPGCASGFCIPVPDEIESAHLLANECRDELHAAGIDDRDILELADDFVAEDRGESVEEFVGWAIYTDWLRRRWSRGTSRSPGASPSERGRT